MENNCPQCLSADTASFYFQKCYERTLFRCLECDLKFVLRSDLIGVKAEKERYEQHENNIRTRGYENFLKRIIDPVKEKLPFKSLGLDFGEGPYPMLRELLAEAGYLNTIGYDPIFNKDPSFKNHQYDFVTCCEVIEHMKEPHKEINLISSLLRPKGLLVVSTGILYEKIDFTKWAYLNDITHINFYSERALLFLAESFGLEVVDMFKDLVVYRKK